MTWKSKSWILTYIHSDGFCSPQARVAGIVLHSRLHEKYWIFLVPLSLSGQFSTVTAVCHESIVLRHAPRWIDLWASASKFSFSVKRSEAEITVNNENLLLFISLRISKYSCFLPCRSQAGHLRVNFISQDRKLLPERRGREMMILYLCDRLISTLIYTSSGVECTAWWTIVWNWLCEGTFLMSGVHKLGELITNCNFCH